MLFDNIDLNPFDGPSDFEEGAMGHDAMAEQAFGFDDAGHQYAPGHPMSPASFEDSPHLIESNGGFDFYNADGDFIRHFETDQVLGADGDPLPQFDQFNIYSDHGHLIHKGEDTELVQQSHDNQIYYGDSEYQGSGPLLNHDDPLAHMDEYRMPPLAF
ncbi:MAG TPA: hypothetical protein PLK94_00025 [Alphaproteobacteria bacterium]|nr:hypothetical protein [Alphaproteobacteria bacterium]